MCCVYGSQTKLNNYLNPVFRAAFERIPTLVLQGQNVSNLYQISANGYLCLRAVTQILLAI